MIGYRLHEFPAAAQPLPDPWGGVVPAAEYPFRIGAMLKQWANIELAQAHVAAAVKSLAEMDPELDAVPNFTDLRANRRQARLQFGFLVSLAKHIARAYNALGILWYNDPDHRVIYRKYFSGNPSAVRGNLALVFDRKKNWGGLLRWWLPNEQFPLVPTGKALDLGVLPQQARMLFDKYGKDLFGGRVQTHKIHFVQQFSFIISPQDNAINDNSSQNVYNVGNIKNETLFAWDQDTFECVNYMAEPWSADDQARDDARCFVRSFDEQAMAVDVGSLKAGTPVTRGGVGGDGQPGNFKDWRAFSYDFNRNAADSTVPLRVAPPLRSYLPYLAEVAESLRDRHPYTVIQSARAFPIWNNVQTAAANGGVADAVRHALTRDADIMRQEAAGSDELRAASEITKSLIPTIAPAIPFPGNIITMVIGGVAGAVMDVLNSTVIKGRISNHGRDELGRYKIIFDPQVLYRNIEDPNPPTFPDAQDSAPTGFQQDEASSQTFRDILRLNQDIAVKHWLANRYGLSDRLGRLALENAIKFQPPRTRDSKDSEEDNTGMLLLGLGAAGILYYAMTRGPSPASVSAPAASAPTATAEKKRTKSTKKSKK